MNHQDKQLSSNQLFLSVILMVVGAHLCNDLIQSMLTATYPLLEEKYRLTFAQVGCISLVYQFTASILQPVIGFYTDKHPKPYLLPLSIPQLPQILKWNRVAPFFVLKGLKNVREKYLSV